MDEKCAYHTRSRAVARCIGCKQPVCATCRDEGERGLCDKCTHKEAEVAAPAVPDPGPGRPGSGQLAEGRGPKPSTPGIAGIRPLPERDPSRKAPGADEGRSAIPGAPGVRPVQPRVPAGGPTQRADVVYCFRHKDIRASGPCSTCGRPYCPACLNTAGFCGLCAQHNEEARRRAFSAPGAEGAGEAAAAKGRGWAVQGLVAVLMLAGAGWAYHRIKQPAPEAARVNLASQLKSSELTAEERAFMDSLKRQRRVAMPDAPRQPALRQPAHEVAPVEAQAEARRVTLGHAPPARPAPQALAPVEAVSIQALTPADGSIVGGRAPIRVWTAGTVAKVVCEVDGGVIGVQAGPQPVFLWNTRASGNGPHQVTVTASGRGGTTSASLTLNVMNR